MREIKQNWLLLAACSLAGGASVKQAVENADKISDAAKDRFKEDGEDRRGDDAD